MTAAHDDLLAELVGAADSPWAILAQYAAPLSSIITDARLGREVSPARLRTVTAARRDSLSGVTLLPGRGGKSTAVVPVSGIATFGIDFPPFAFSSRKLASTMNELAADTSIERIVLDFATPGGFVTGIPEAADAIFAARKRTTVHAIANPMAASAGYWLASQADRVAVIPSGEVGSVGVFAMHLDASRALDAAGLTPTFIVADMSPHKVEFNMFEPLSKTAKKRALFQVNSVGADFLRAIARGRRMSVATVRATFGGGRVLLPKEALSVGMVDRIATFDQTLATALSLAPGAKQGGAVARAPSPRSVAHNPRHRRLALLRHGATR